MNAFVFKNSNTMKKLVTLILAMSMVAALLVPALMACSAEEVSTPSNTQAQSTTPVSSYDFEDIEYNHTPTFPCVGDSTVIVYPDPKDATNKALLVDSAGTAATATYYFADISEKFEVSVDVYAPKLCNWQVGLFPDQFDGRIQFAVTGDANGNLLVTANTVSTYKAGEWFNVRIVADPKAETGTVYINGSLIAENVKYYSSGVGYGYSGACYLSNKDKNGEMYFDNLITPIHKEVHVEKYIPEYIKAQILSSAEPEQCGHVSEKLLYSAFPSVKKINDEKVIIIFHRGVKHAYSHGVLDCIVFNPKTEEVISQSVIYDDPEHNAQNADLMILPNGDLYITLNEQYPNDSADPYESLVFRSTDEGETWVKSQQPTDQFGHHYSVVHDYTIVGNDVYMLAQKDPDLNNDETLDYMCLVKSSDNCETWEYISNLEKDMLYLFNESTIEYWNGKLLFVGRGDKKVTKAALINLDGTIEKIRNIGVDFDCIDHNGKAEIVVKDGEYYLILRNMLHDVGNAMELPLYRIDPATLSLETYVELQPKNTGTNGGDGFYAESYFQEKDGETYFNVVTYTRAYTNTSSGVPSIVRFEYKWDEIKDPKVSANAKIDEIDAIKQSLSEMGRNESVTLTFDRPSYNNQQIGGTTNREGTGIAGATSDGNADRVFCVAQGVNGTGAVKWSGSPAQETAVIFGKENTSANGLNAAYKLAPNRKYTVTYQISVDTKNVTFGLKALNTYKKAEVSEGYTIASHTTASKISSFTTYTETFTTPDAATLGDNVYLSFFVNKGANNTITALLDNVTIIATVDATAADVITFNDNGKLYYANSADLAALPEGNNAPDGCEFEGWAYTDGKLVANVPENGSLIVAKYSNADGSSSMESTTVTLTFDKLLTEKNIGGNANGVSGIIAANPSSGTVYSRKFGGNYAIKANGTSAKNVISLYFARDDYAYTGDQFAYILSPNTKYTVSFDECVTPLTAGTTVTYQWMAVRSSSSAVVSSGLKLGEPITVTAAGTNYTNHTVEFTMPSIAEIGKNARLELVITYDGTASTDKYSSFVDNVVITKYKTEKPNDIEMLQMSSIRGESTNGQGQYISAGIRFRSRVTEDFHNKATEMGFIAVPSEALGDKDIADYTGNLAISAKVLGEGMNEIVYEVSTDDNGSNLYDYQLIITGLTRQGVTENLLDTKITVAMYAVIDGEKIFTESVSYSYADVLAATLKK